MNIILNKYLYINNQNNLIRKNIILYAYLYVCMY